MSPNILIFIALLLLTVFRVGNRAYLAYTNGFKTWPIIAGLGAIYLIFVVIRLVTGTHDPMFLLISIGCLLISGFLYNAGAKAQ